MSTDVKSATREQREDWRTWIETEGLYAREWGAHILAMEAALQAVEAERDALKVQLREQTQRAEDLLDSRDVLIAQLEAIDVSLAEGVLACKVSVNEYAFTLALHRLRILFGERDGWKERAESAEADARMWQAVKEGANAERSAMEAQVRERDARIVSMEAHDKRWMDRHDDAQSAFAFRVEEIKEAHAATHAALGRAHAALKPLGEYLMSIRQSHGAMCHVGGVGCWNCRHALLVEAILDDADGQRAGEYVRALEAEHEAVADTMQWSMQRGPRKLLDAHAAVEALRAKVTT